VPGATGAGGWRRTCHHVTSPATPQTIAPIGIVQGTPIVDALLTPNAVCQTVASCKSKQHVPRASPWRWDCQQKRQQTTLERVKAS